MIGSPHRFTNFHFTDEPITGRTAPMRAEAHTGSSYFLMYYSKAPYFHHLLMDKTPWYANFPTPRSTPRTMTNEEVFALLTNPEKKAGKDYLIVDVRRTDFGVSPCCISAKSGRIRWFTLLSTYQHRAFIQHV